MKESSWLQGYKQIYDKQKNNFEINNKNNNEIVFNGICEMNH